MIDGKSIASTILNELRVETQEWVSMGHRAPRLVAVLVGQDPASKTYVKNKMKAAKVVGCYLITILNIIFLKITVFINRNHFNRYRHRNN